MPAFKTIALFGRYNTRESGQALSSIARFLKSRGCAILLDETTASTCGLTAFPTADLATIGAQADLAVVLGGDGSMLNAARSLAVYGVPLVGVNQGRLGFMTDIAADSMLESVGAILEGEFSREERTLLSVDVRRGGASVFESLALNDVVVNKGAVGRMIEFLVHIDGAFVYDLRSDGLIVCTPTGSTAYALSSNGPIVQPGVPGFALVPICPHTLSNRPITISDSAVIEITLRRAQDARLHYDGQLQGDLAEGTQVVLRRSAHTIQFVHPPGYNYFAMLREKLHWSEIL